MNNNLNHHHIALEMDKVLLRLSSFASSELGKEECKNLSYLKQREQIKYELKLVDLARKIIDNTQQTLPLNEIADVDKIFKQNRLTVDEILELAELLKAARLCKNFISKNEDCDELIEISKNLYTDKAFEDEIFSVFDSELNVKDDASNELKSLRTAYKARKENLRDEINKLLSNHSFVENLQDIVVSTRENRPVFQVKASCKNKVSGIVHDISSTNMTYFIEPSELVPLSNKIRQTEIEINAEIERILLKLSNRLKEIKDELSLNKNILIKLDTIFAKAKYSIHLHGVSAQLSDNKIIDIQGMRHPLLVEIKGENVVANDFKIGFDYGCLLITGSNTGGKTVALKTVGLFILMTCFGMHVPCLGAKIYPYSDIYCDISTEQNLEQGISTYCAHITNISDILNQINENSFVLLDELGSGTDPTEGASIARAILEYIKDKNSQCIITTHLGELKTLKYENKYFENATVLFDVATLKPKYNLIIGMSGTSNAIDISSALGLNSQIIKRAKEIFSDTNSKDSKLFLEIEKTNQSLIEKEQKAKDNLENAKKTNEEYTEKLKELKQTKKKSLDNFKKKFQNQLESARDEIKEIVDGIRKEKSLKVAMRSYDRLNKIEAQIRQEFSNSDDELSEKYKELKPEELKIGQSVLIKKLNQVVLLDGLPDKKGFVKVKIGNIVSKVKLGDLAKTDKKIAPHLKKVQVSFDNHDNLLSRLDLRGMRAIDAVDFLDKQLDKASLRGLNQVTVIHGYGTGALKSAINDYLKNSPYVSKFRYGDETEGRDGVVIIDIL